MTTKHDIWLAALQGHEKAPLNDQDLRQAIELINDAINSLEALNSDHYHMVIHELKALDRRLYGRPNIVRAMMLLSDQGEGKKPPESPVTLANLEDGNARQSAKVDLGGHYPVAYTLVAHVPAKLEGDDLVVDQEALDLESAKHIVVDHSPRKMEGDTRVILNPVIPDSEQEIPGCRCCGQTKYNCVACGWELGSG